MKLSEMTKHEGGRYHDGSNFLPWYSSPCLEWLMTLDLQDRKVFEFGVGDSTTWYKSRGAITAGVDSNEKYVHQHCAWHGDDEAHYLRSIGFISKECFDLLFDIVIIDGDYRDKCTEEALKYLKPGGYLIIDNWKQATVEPDWPITEKLIEGMEQTLYLEPNHWDKWGTLVVKKPL